MNKLLMTAAIALVLVPSTALAGDSDSDSDRYKRYDRWDRSERYQPYDRRSGRNHYGRHDRGDLYRRMQRVQILAHRLEKAARHVHREAERRGHHLSFGEERAMRALHILEDRARHFHRESERYRTDPYHLEADFRALEDAFFKAARSLHYAHADRHVRRDFERVDRAMYELTATFEPLVRRSAYRTRPWDHHR